VPLSAGTRLGHYEIIEALGAGGMGEVYKARDPRLERTVAVKVLPSHLSADPQLRQRFEREAKAISQLSHPHICVLHDVGHEDGVDFLVMELLDGETLADRLERGPVPPAEVLSIGTAIADALDRAHRQNIVHRDLKPANVMLTKSGPKLLDFGLARTLVASAGSAASALTSLPTEAAGSQPLTTEGTLLGTFQYMAPEQLEGEEADARTDVFALGAMLYEMATGRPAFAGKSRASLISSIMSSTPAPISSVQPLSPPALDRVIHTCLAKDRDERIQTAHDVKLQLQWIAEGGSQAGVPGPVATRRRSRERMAWIVAAVAGVAALALGATTLMRRAPQPALMRFQIQPPAGVLTMRDPIVSPDGQYIAFTGRDSAGQEQIWVRPLGDLDATPLPGTVGARRGFWSPDSRHLAFVHDGKLKKVAISGGTPQTLGDAPGGEDGDWGRSDVILFDGQDWVSQISGSGGLVTAATALDSAAGDNFHGWPEFLPDGKHFLVVVYGSNNRLNLAAGSLDRKGLKQLPGGPYSLIRYAPPGYLLYVRDGTLLAQPFDAGRLEFKGDPVPLAEGLPLDVFGNTPFSVSDSGVLLFQRGRSGERELAWFDRTGRRIRTDGPPGDIQNPALSPDGKRIAMRRRDPQSGDLDVWILAIDRGTVSRFTFDPQPDSAPIWSPDGAWIAFNSSRDSLGMDIYRKRSSGIGGLELLVESKNDKYPTSWSRDGRYIVYWEEVSPGNVDVRCIDLSGDRKPFDLVATPANERSGMLSPDGRWLAYASNESGRLEIYVQGFPEPQGKWQVSINGGNWPAWRSDGRELYYIGPDQRLMAVPVTAGEGLEAGIPVPLFTLPEIGPARNRYEVSADGQRFLVHVPVGLESVSPFNVVVNWQERIRR
jgi:Tol biopolymer transport system component